MVRLVSLIPLVMLVLYLKTLLPGSTWPVSVCLVGSVVFLCDLTLRNIWSSMWWTPALTMVTCLLNVKSTIVEVAQLLTLGNVASLLHACGSPLVHRLVIM